MEKKSMKQRVVALVSAGALAASMAAMPALAFADNTPSQVGSGTNGTGVTHLNMITKDDGGEHTSSDGNVAFTYPSAINYVVAANGTLTGPAGTAAYIESDSVMQIHVNAVQVQSSNGWHYVDTAAKTTSENTNDNVFLKLGPSDHELNLANFTTKANVPNADRDSWNMAADGSQIALASTGNVGKVAQDITAQTEFGQVTWYVKAGPTAQIQG